MKIGIYPGTFDPITHGHTDIITRSLRVFDKVMVAVAPNPTKHPLFNLAERLEMVQLVLKDPTCRAAQGKNLEAIERIVNRGIELFAALHVRDRAERSPPKSKSRRRRRTRKR